MTGGLCPGEFRISSFTAQLHGIGALGYLVVAALYLVLTALLLTVWRGRKVGTYLVVACTISIVWGILLALQSVAGPLRPIVFFSIEVLRIGAWIAFLCQLLLEIGASRQIRYTAQFVWLGVFIAGLVVWANMAYLGSAQSIGRVLFPGGLAIALTGLVLIEQLYRNSPSESRWKLKLLVLGLGGIFAFDLFLYSQAVLFGALDTSTWLARGPVNIIFVPLIALAIRRNPDWKLRIFVSRQVVFYSTTLTAVGLYLLLMSAGGYLITLYGGSWGGLAQVVFFAGAVIVLFTLLFSGTLRAKIKVFLSKHFFQNKYDYRQEWLGLISTLSRFKDRSTREVVVEAMARLVDSPSGHLWMLNEDDKSYRHASKYGAEETLPDVSGSDSLIEFIHKKGWLIDLAEYAREPDLYGDLELPEWLTQRNLAWLLVPLMYGDELLGFVLLDNAPGVMELNYEDRDLLKTVGNHIAVHLAQERVDRLLSEAKQFEAYNRLTAFLMHDLNNLIAQQSLIVKNAEKHKRNPDFVDDTIATITNSVTRMNKIMDQLKRRETDRDVRSIIVSDAIGAALKRCAGQKPVPTMDLTNDSRVLANADEFSMVLSHLIRNAQDATGDSGSVVVKACQKDGGAIIQIIDDGAGMSMEFVRDRLFRPFDSTKGVEGMGIGAYQAREFARKLGGDLKIKSEPGKGTTVTMTLNTAE